MTIRAVLFDLGSTLWDVDYSGEDRAYRMLYRCLKEETGLRIPPAKKLRDAVADVFLKKSEEWRNGDLHEGPTEEVYAEALESLGLDVPASKLTRLAEDVLSESIIYTVAPDTPDALRALKERGLEVGCVSNTYQSSRSLEKSLVRYGLMQHIDTLVTSSEVGWQKPHPAIFEEALRRLNVEARETVFVGDMVWADIQGAQALGMKAVLTHQYREEDPDGVKPDLIVQRLSEVVGYVDRLNGADE
jgi:HAD superfamily hydrolase (TIGR01662 family)